MKKLLVYLGVIALMGTSFSCNKDDNGSTPIVQKTSYEFTRDGKNTVFYDGQNIRLMMVNDIANAFKNKDNNYNKIESMFAHVKGANDFENTELNESDKQVKDKVASSKLFFDNGTSALSTKIKNQFSEFIKIQTNEVFPNWDNEASAGKAGQLVFGTTTRHFDSRGLEMDQMLKKGLIGGLILDQSINNYLAKVKDDNNEVKEGKDYTEMEHHWDEAYGYIFGGGKNNVTGPDKNGNFPKNNEFVKYLNTVDNNPNFKGIAQKVFQAFVDGRQAIVEKKYDVRDANIKIIREKTSLVVAVRGVHYLLEGKTNIDRGTRISGFHGLSEGVGFVYSLQFTNNPATGKPYFSHEEVTTMLNDLLGKEQDGLWGVTSKQIEKNAKLIADKFGFTLNDAK